MVAAFLCRWPAGETQGSFCARMRALCLLASATIIGRVNQWGVPINAQGSATYLLPQVAFFSLLIRRQPRVTTDYVVLGKSSRFPAIPSCRLTRFPSPIND